MSLAVFLILVAIIYEIDMKICPTIDIRNHPSQLNKLEDCQIVNGSLYIVLMDNYSYEDFVDYSFPELREVSDYVIIFRIKGLWSLETLFPNLALIRGNKLFRDDIYSNALVIFDMPNMTRIGLPSLKRIQRGYVHIGKSPNLCFVNTVNWTALGTSLVDFAEVPNCEGKEECAPDCNGHCWAPGKCQEQYEDCDSECLGCTKPRSPKHCLVCRNWRDGDTCVSECPTNKFFNVGTIECLTEEECTSLKSPTEHWIFGRHCLYVNTCPENYEYSSSKKTCTICNEICNKTCGGISVRSKKEIEQLQGCTHITGNLELVVKDKYLVDQLSEVLVNISEIDGCLKVARSDALTSLEFLKNLRRIGGKDTKRHCNNHTVYIQGNPHLRTLTQSIDIKTSINAKVSFHYNPKLCIKEIERFVKSLGMTSKHFNNILEEGKYISRLSNGERGNCSYLSLNVTITDHHARNITFKWEPHNSSDTTIIGYTVHYMFADDIDILSNYMCDRWNSYFVLNNTIQLTQLLPFSVYFYKIEIYRIEGIGGSTENRVFTTLPDDPTQPLSFETEVISPTSINITWKYPEFSNGNLSHYRLIAFVEKFDRKFTSRRNYCIYPHIIQPNLTEIDFNNQTKNGDCVCEMTNLIMNNTFCGSSHFTKMFSNTDCNKFMYQVFDKEEKKTILKRNIFEAKSGPRIQPNETVIEIKIPADDTNYVLRNLTPFTSYIILFSACNEEFRNKSQCSGVILSAERTKANISADQVRDITLTVMDHDSVLVSWKDPSYPNGMIVAYNIEFRTINTSKSVCITYKQHIRNNSTYQINNVHFAELSLRVRPISLHGPGLYSKFIFVQTETDMNPWIIYFFIWFFLLILIVVFIYSLQKKENSFYQVYLINNAIQEYQAVIIESNLELNREDIEVQYLLGQGKFVRIFRGYIKPRQLPCAIKILNDNASIDYRRQFLREGYIMKSFCEAHHVVEIFGVVLITGPPLILMELMGKGDLKHYLQEIIDSYGLFATEMYEMAAQIADGMAYLTSKNFVYADLSARNCMVAADGTVKIGSFGISKDVYTADYYSKDGGKLCPIRWMAPESFAEEVFSSESDVWSYGIVLWEIVTFAELPYEEMSNEEVLIYVASGGRLKRPPQTPNILWEIMKVCWLPECGDRPQFLDILQKLEQFVSTSFASVSFYHTQARFNSNPSRVYNFDRSSKFPELVHEHNSYPQEDDKKMLLSDD